MEDDEPTLRDRLEAILFPEAELPTRAAWVGRAVVYVGLVAWGVRFLAAGFAPGLGAEPLGGSFMHLVNLPFHEAGHLFFMLFGRFMGILGGTLGQLLMPTICLGVMLLKTRDAFGASVCLWWLGQSHLDVAPYVDDARAQRLMLIGDVTGRESGMHDWNNLLTDLGWLMSDHLIARAFFGLGALLLLASFAWGGAALWRQHVALREAA